MGGFSGEPLQRSRRSHAEGTGHRSGRGRHAGGIDDAGVGDAGGATGSVVCYCVAELSLECPTISRAFLLAMLVVALCLPGSAHATTAHGVRLVSDVQVSH